jgi:hypothetical protein
MSLLQQFEFHTKKFSSQNQTRIRKKERKTERKKNLQPKKQNKKHKFSE